ncbi:MAG: RNA pseudouridine synthase, partial [Treponema sp.]|nr:RNA pseudouridine synthase [Treponema sp.]
LDILCQLPGLLILNKPAGIAVHGPESLDTRVQGYLAGKIKPSLSFKPGPLHRLDKPTSGIIVFSLSLEGAQRFSALIRERRIKKQYLALIDGILEGPQVWEDELVRDKALHKTFIPAGNSARGAVHGAVQDTPPAKSALTRVQPLASCFVTGKGYTLIRAEIETGRTHQIRAQAAAHAHPLTGDKKYGGSVQSGGFLLHARKLEFPGDDEEHSPICITAPLPENFCRRITALFGQRIALEYGA